MRKPRPGKTGAGPDQDERCALLDDQNAAAVLAPVLFAVADNGRTFLAVGYGAKTAGRHTQRNQIILHRIGPALAQGQIVFAGSTLVTMSFDGHALTGEMVQPIGLLAQYIAGAGGQF